MLKKVWGFFLFLSVWASLASGHRYPTEFQAKVTHITDGDTIKVRRLNTKNSIKIHLKAIDCPERDQVPYGNQATQMTRSLLKGQVVTIKVYYRYGQWLNDVILEDSRSLNQELVKAGLAWWNFKNSDDEHLATLEFMAKALKVGLWQDGDPIPPWDFRKAKRKSLIGRRANSSGLPNGR